MPGARHLPWFGPWQLILPVIALRFYNLFISMIEPYGSLPTFVASLCDASILIAIARASPVPMIIRFLRFTRRKIAPQSHFALTCCCLGRVSPIRAHFIHHNLVWKGSSDDDALQTTSLHRLASLPSVFLVAELTTADLCFFLKCFKTIVTEV